MDNGDKSQQTLGISYMNIPLKHPPPYWTFPQFIRDVAEKAPDKEAVVFLSPTLRRKCVTFKEVHEKSEKFAKALRNLGVEKGEVVGMNIPNSPELLFALFGTIMAGAIPFALSFTYTDGRDIVAILNKIDNCTTFVLDPGQDNKNWLTFQHVVTELGDNGLIISNKIQSLKTFIFTSKPPATNEEPLLMSAMIHNVNEDTELPVLDPEDTCILFQTSGSTGMPKVVARSHYSICYATATFPDFIIEQDIYYNERQFGWSGGFPLNFFGTGYTLVTRSLKSTDVVDCTKFLIEAVKQEKCTAMSVLPSVLGELILRKDEVGSDWPVHTIRSGGQPLSTFHATCTDGLCQNFMSVYGCTEATICFMETVQSADEFEEYSCGQTAPGIEMKVVDDSGHVIAVNKRGELWLRGQYLFSGYYNDPKKTREVKTETGWYKTGDVGFMTENKKVFIEGRKSDEIISGGLNVAPAILESLLRSIDGIKGAFVVPVPHPILFQVICACLRKAEGSHVTAEAVREYVEQIHADKPRTFTVLPAHYIFFDSFPLTNTGKVSRKKLAVSAEQRLENNNEI